MRRWIAAILLTAIITSPLIIPQALKRFRTDHVRTDVSLYVGDKNVFGFLDKVETASQTIGSSGITDNSITSNDLTTALLQFVGSGGNVENFPDDSTLGALPDSTIYIKNNAIRLAHLGNEVRNWIQNSQTSNNLYDYQDASINEALQMHVRWAHYWFDKYYTDTDTTLTYEYDASGAIYIGERRGIGSYATLLKTLHKLTGDSRYWNLMVELVNKMDGTREKIAESGGGAGSDTCWTYNLHTNTDWDTWLFDDVKWHRIKYYIYKQDPLTYASYLPEIKSFVNVTASYLDSSASYPGWGWGYGWISSRPGAAADRIVNTNAPIFPLWAELRTDGVTLDERITTVADYDTLMDSVWAYIDGAWIWSVLDTSGGWGYDYADVGTSTISKNYNYVILRDMMEAAEILADTGFVDSLMQRLQAVVGYTTRMNGTNYNTLNTYWTVPQTWTNKWLDKYNLPLTGNDSLYRSQIANAAYMGGYAAGNWGDIVFEGDSRRSGSSNTLNLSILIEYFNNASFPKWNHYARQNDGGDFTNWTTNGAGFYLSDGNYILQDYFAGVNSAGTGAVLSVGYRHDDSTPGSQNPDLGTFNNTTNVLNWRLPSGGNASNGLYYNYYHQFGTPHVKIVPSAADSVWILVDDPGESFGDSTYFYYYNLAGQLDTLKNTTLDSGQTVTIDLTQGLFIQNTATSGAVKGYQGAYLIGNKSSVVLEADRDNGTNKLYVIGRGATTKPDSIMVGILYHQVGGWFLENPTATGWQYSISAARNVLETVKAFWDNGLGYDGILEDKIQ